MDAEGGGSEVLGRSLFSGVRGPGSAECQCLQRSGIHCEGVGRRPGSPGPGPEAAAGVLTGDAATSIRAHLTLLSFRTTSVKDSSFVEKMKKTVSLLSEFGCDQQVLALGVLRGVQQGASCTGQERAGRHPGQLSHVCILVVPKPQSCAAVAGAAYFVFLNIYFLNRL